MTRRYSVKFVYARPGKGSEGIRFGKAIRSASLDEIDFMFKSVSVDNCVGWISSVKSLRKGGTAVIRTVEGTSSKDLILKSWEIKRN